MNDKQLKIQLASRELGLGDIFQESYRMLASRLSWFILLTLIIYIPANVLTELLLYGMPQEIGIDEYSRVVIVQGAVSVYSMIGVSVTAIIVRDHLEETEQERGFWACFSEGIRTWPYFLVTLLMFMAVVVGAMVVIMLIAGMIPLLLVLGITVMIIGSVLAVLYVYGTCIMAALHRSVFMKNIRQVTFVLKNHLGRSLGLMILITLVSLAVTFPVLNMSQTIAMATGSPVLGIILNVIVETVLSIFNIYMNIAMVLRFMNLEQICRENSIF